MVPFKLISLSANSYGHADRWTTVLPLPSKFFDSVSFVCHEFFKKPVWYERLSSPTEKEERRQTKREAKAQKRSC